MQNGWSESWSQYNGLINENDVVIRNVRLQSNAGWYIGAVQFYNYEEMDFYSRDSDYYPNENVLQEVYPNSISIEEAFYNLKYDRLLKRKMERYLNSTKTKFY